MAINEEVYKNLGLKGFLGALPERIYKHLGSLGHVGTISDRLFKEGGYLSYITNLLGVVSRYFVTLDPVLNSSYEMAQPITFTGDFEIEVEFSTPSGGTQVILSSTTNDFIALASNSTKVRVNINGSQADSTTLNLTDGKLHKVKVIRVGSSITTFVDGIQNVTFTSAGTSSFKYVGSWGNTSLYFNGIIANVKFTDKSGASDVVTTFKLDQATANIEYSQENVFGSEEVVNGDFSNGTVDWDALSSASLSVFQGALRITNVGANFGKATQQINTITGKAYELTFSGISRNTDSRVRVGTTPAGTNILSNLTWNIGYNRFVFITSTTVPYVTFVGDGVDGSFIEIENVSVKAALTLAST